MSLRIKKSDRMTANETQQLMERVQASPGKTRRVVPTRACETKRRAVVLWNKV